MPPTSAGRCRSSTASSSAASRRTFPRFNKFLQGYYDDVGIIEESFDAVVQSDRLSPEMAALGMRLDKTVEPTHLLPRLQHGRPGGRRAGRRARPQAAPGHEPRHRQPRIPRALHERPRHAGAVADAAGHLRLRRRLQEPVSPVRPRARAPAAGRGRLPERHRSGDRHAAASSPSTPATPRAAAACSSSSSSTPGASSASTSRSRHHLQPIPGQGAARRLPDLHLGLGRRLPGPGELPLPAGVPDARSKSGGPNTANFCNPEFDRLFLRDEGPAQRRARAPALIRRMLAILERERPWIELFHAEDYALSHGWLVNAKPMGISYPASSTRTSTPELRARLQARVEPPGALAAVCSCCVAVVALTVPAVQDLLPGAPVMLAYLVRRIAYGARHRARRAVPAVRAVLRRHRPRRHRAQGGRREAPPGGLRAVEEEPRLRQAAVLSDCGSDASATPTRCSSSTFAACSPSTSVAATPTTCRSPARLREGAGPSLASRCRCSCSGWWSRIGRGAVRRLLPRDLHRPAVLVVCVLTMSVSMLLYIIGGQYLVGKLLKWFPISGFDPDPAVIARFLALPVLVGVVSGFGADVRFYRTVFVEEIEPGLRAHRARQGLRRCPRHGAARAAQRADPDPDPRRRGDPVPVHRRRCCSSRSSAFPGSVR